jgi:hypothetical protein
MIRPDGTFDLDVHDPIGSFYKDKGKWTSKPGEPQTVHMSILGKEAVDTTIAGATPRKLKLKLPGLAEMNMDPEVECERLFGTEIDMDDAKHLHDESMKWLAANINIPQPQKMLADMDAFIERATDNERMFSIAVGAGMTRARKPAILVAGFDKVFTFDLTPAQLAHFRVEPQSIQTSTIKRAIRTMKPEIKIDTITIDTKNGWDTTKPLPGKIKMHAIGQAVDATYVLRIFHSRGFTTADIAGIPGPEGDTFDFKIPAMDGAGQSAKPIASGPNPMPVLIVVARSERPFEKNSANYIDFAVSEPKAVLLDMLPLFRQPDP